MTLRLLADALLVLHLGYILFVVFGGFLAARRPWLRWVHLPAAAWGALVNAGNFPCPITTWEVQLRVAAGGAGYEGGFIEHYLLAVIYPDGLTRAGQAVLAVAVVAINLWAYRRPIRRVRTRDAGAATTDIAGR
jgi:hypothetical protein